MKKNNEDLQPESEGEAVLQGIKGVQINVIGDDDKSDQDGDEKNEIVINEDPYTLLSIKNILGKVYYTRWRRKKEYFFALDLQKGRILMYKTMESKKVSTYYTIAKGAFCD